MRNTDDGEVVRRELREGGEIRRGKRMTKRVSYQASIEGCAGMGVLKHPSGHTTA